jgi:hypothetical protein
MSKGAHFSEDRKYRYALWRIWNEDKPLAMFIGLNPSKARESKDDPTIRRVTRFAYDWGCGGFYMMNLFAYVTPYPAELVAAADPLGENDIWLEKINLKCDRICFAWGQFGAAKNRRIIQERANDIISRYPGAFCLGKTAGGHPRHPLFLLTSTKPEPFNNIVI